MHDNNEVEMQKAIVIIPTYNAGRQFEELMRVLSGRTLNFLRVIIIDSSSIDNTIEVADRYGHRVLDIDNSNFNHGGTRQWAVEQFPDAEIAVFLTQDALPADTAAIYKLIAAFDDPQVGCAYGRQLPHEDAGPLGAHARLFNYPAESRMKSSEDAPKLGIKTAFISNSFAAYRVSALKEVGGFPIHTILSEDTYVAAKMVLAGWKVAYCAEAQVYHSHDYTIWQEFQRYFDTGVFHGREAWIRQSFGQAEGEGLRFVLSEWRYLLQNGYGYLIPSAIVRTMAKFAGYKLGMMEKKLPLKWKRKFSMHKRFWDQDQARQKG